MFSRFEKTLLAFMLTLLIAGVSILAASAQVVTPPPAEEENACANCHEDHAMS